MNTIKPHDRRIKILIVDDNAQMRQLLKLTFGFDKYQLFEADNANKAISLVISELPDIVLLDIMMPGDCNGLDVCEFIKSSSFDAMRVILLSAKSQKNDIEAGMQAGADAYITKPFSPLELLELVEQQLATSPS